MNVVMFVPAGFVYALSRARGRSGTRVPWVGALVLGAVLSGMVELAQVFAPSRFPSVFDLAANTAGAGLGGWLAGAALESARERGDASAAVRALAVDLPLMGLTYLVVPLVWLVALGAEDPRRLWSAAPLATAAAWAIASVLTSFEGAKRSRVALATGAWLAVALLPSMIQRPGATILIALIAAGVAWARTAAPSALTHESFEGKPSRRFEATTLRFILPLFVLHLVLSALLPWSPPADTWSGAFGLAPRGQGLADRDIYRALEQIAAFTLLGYAIAEYHGRVHHRARRLLASVLAWTTPAAALIQWMRGWHPEHGASGMLLVATIVCAWGGGWIYVLQLEHVRALAARPMSLASAKGAS